MDCHKCCNRASLPGNAHISCRRPDATVKVNAHGFRNGWAYWPLDFDPVWIESCDCFNKPPTDIEGGALLAHQVASLMRMAKRQV